MMCDSRWLLIPLPSTVVRIGEMIHLGEPLEGRAVADLHTGKLVSASTVRCLPRKSWISESVARPGSFSPH